MMRAMRAISAVLSLVVLSACGATPEPTPAPTPFRPVADVKQLMANVVEPAAEGYWDAVGSVVDASGVTEIRPKSAEEWDVVRAYAYTVTESGNLLLMPGRIRNDEAWTTMAQAMIQVGQKAIRAAEAKNPDAVFDTGAELYDTCTACHAKYAAEIQRPNSVTP
jgi:hypothetical protein